MVKGIKGVQTRQKLHLSMYMYMHSNVLRANKPPPPADENKKPNHQSPKPQLSQRLMMRTQFPVSTCNLPPHARRHPVIRPYPSSPSCPRNPNLVTNHRSHHIHLHKLDIIHFVGSPGFEFGSEKLF